MHQGLLLHGKILKARQKETLTMTHQGVQRCCLRAKQSVWWPGITHQIDNFVKQCPTCMKDATPNSEPMLYTELPDFLWQRVGSDLFMLKGGSYLLIVDYFLRFPETIKLKTTTLLVSLEHSRQSFRDMASLRLSSVITAHSMHHKN